MFYSIIIYSLFKTKSMDINDIKTYLKYENQKKAIMQAMRIGISKQKFLEMKKKAGFTNWTFEKRKYKKELDQKKEDQKKEDLEKEKKELKKEKEDLEKKDVDLEEDNNIIFQEIDQDNNEDIEIPYITWTNIEKIE